MNNDYDLFVIGGGVNGCGIARDAAGRGLRVGLAEMRDIGWATSSASTKLFHGGLRYLEFFKFRLVREALRERETLLRMMPHISWPMRFVLPLHPEMRFQAENPASRLIAAIFPWLKGRRPSWMIRLGLFFYDHLGGRELLPGTTSIDLRKDPAGQPLKPILKRAFEYSDCWVEDSRLVILNARDADERGADIMIQAKVLQATPSGSGWLITLQDLNTGKKRKVTSKVLVNAAGPWAEMVIDTALGRTGQGKLRLVRGSHIVTRKLFDHQRSYFLQGSDGRIIFAIPYEHNYTLIGTTDIEHPSLDEPPVCTPQEQEYLCKFASQYFRQPVTVDDIKWTYSGVRPLYDDGASAARSATRDYVLDLSSDSAPLLTVYGGKITTYRKLAEAALQQLSPWLGDLPIWTAQAPLPGGDFKVSEVEIRIQDLQKAYPFLTPQWAERLFRAYGTDAAVMLGDAKSKHALGKSFGATLTAREIKWLMQYEYARSAEDVVWRRSRLGLQMTKVQIKVLDSWMKDNRP